MNKLTTAEVKTIAIILANGGAVIASMGRLKGNVINKMTMERLEAKGMITISNYTGRAGPVNVEITVTAAGCSAHYVAEVKAACNEWLER
jgi:chromosome segregation and condensation protein ScpB